MDIWADVCRIIGSSWSVTPEHRKEARACFAGRGVPGITLLGALQRRADEVLAAAPRADVERRIEVLDQQMVLGYQQERVALGYREGRVVGNRVGRPRKVAAARRSAVERCRREIDGMRKERQRLADELKRRAHAQARA
ncbi:MULTISPECIES: hypothetical protein [unclassified Pseudomonas]|uniref:hypothetical protein n=1 Tax=unclassified Pseudomonas TaxID=196821 RepID=UPI000731B7DF|nr:MULTISPECIES: hypothetical protein [unclassified Pseudomonas]KSW28444.1 hypothetical protein AOX63_00125 [Pseudomonas sp. ADP]OBP10047.1 hypothetical protein BAE52_16225 [Pseudomonas sp. EGD-AKN5]QOF85711.1 hypothetical protein IG194_03125 [Pseudomonas sp. ADPe]